MQMIQANEPSTFPFMFNPYRPSNAHYSFGRATKWRWQYHESKTLCETDCLEMALQIVRFFRLYSKQGEIILNINDMSLGFFWRPQSRHIQIWHFSEEKKTQEVLWVGFCKVARYKVMHYPSSYHLILAHTEKRHLFQKGEAARSKQRLGEGKFLLNWIFKCQL